jgi:S-adenosylmethionine decarboxylase
MTQNTETTENNFNYRGSHAMMDICNFHGEETKLGIFVYNLMIKAIERTTMKIVHKHLEILNKDTPPGFSAILSLDSSHISAHSYSSKDIALIAFDCFTCGQTNPLEVLQYIYHELKKDFPDIKCTYEFNHKRFRY